MNTMKTVLLLAALGGLMMGVGAALGGRAGLVVGLVLGFAFVGGSYWFSDTVAIKAARARPVTEQQMPQYYAVVRDLCDRAGMPMPKLYVAPSAQPNAFATGRSPSHAAVAVTQGILDICSWDELRGVLAHEMSHVRNRDILIGSVAAAVALGITFIARIAMWGSLFFGSDDEGNVIGILVMALLAPIAAGILQMALSRSREFQADRSGAKLIGDGEPLARALEKLEAGSRRIPMNIPPETAQAYIVNPLRASRMSMRSLFSSHPPTEERIRRLRAGDWA